MPNKRAFHGCVLALLVLPVAIAATSNRAIAQAGAAVPAAGIPAAPGIDDATGKLFEAAATGDLTGVRTALAGKASLDAANPGRMTALGIAALYGHANVVTELIKAGASLSTRQDGETALIVAAHEGHAPVVDALIAAGADVGAPSIEGMTALMAAAASDRTAIVRTLLAHGAKVDAGDDAGATALMAATFGGNLASAQILIDAGANVNSKDRGGRTPLMASARGGNATLGRLLLDRKADLNAQDLGGSTALVYAGANGHLEFVDLLEKAGLTQGQDQALFFAVEGCYTPVVRRLVEGGASPKAKLDGAPIMVRAASANCSAVIELLASKGADLDAADDDGMTPLMHAAEMGYVPVVRALLDHGADPEKTNADKQTAWVIASMIGQREVADVFKTYRDAHPLKP